MEHTVESRNAFRLAMLPALLAGTIGLTGHAWAVQGGVVAAGSGAISTQGNRTTISQSSERMVVNWNNFDIARNQSVAFNQPSTTSAVLNRVASAAPTKIDGSLTANGRVFVVNPAGVMFGKSAKVDVGALVASAMNVDKDEFMNGGSAYTFYGRKGLVMQATNDDATVSNDGQITAREAVVLLGPKALNQGTISAKDVTLAAGHSAALKLDDSSFAVDIGQAAWKALVANSGKIIANGGNVNLTASAAGAMLATVVNNSGVIEATRATAGQDGKVILGSEGSGDISAGGHVTADAIQVISSTKIWSDGNTDPRMKSFDSDGNVAARNVTVEAGAKLNADQGLVMIATDFGKVDVNGRVNANAVDIYAYGGRVNTNEKITGGDVKLAGGGVTINAPIQATRNITIDANHWGQSTDLKQNANVNAATGNVTLSGGSIVQASGIKTVGGKRVTIRGATPSANSIATERVEVADVKGDTVDISGSLVTLKGDVTAENDISVLSKRVPWPPCWSEICMLAVNPSGRLEQQGNVTSRYGSVEMTGHEIKQAASSKTKAGGDIKLSAQDDLQVAPIREEDDFVYRYFSPGSIQTAKNVADGKIVLDARYITLGGALKSDRIEYGPNVWDVKTSVADPLATAKR